MMRTPLQYWGLRALFRQIHEDWCAHCRDWSQPGFRALAVHRYGNWLNDRRKGLLRSTLRVFYILMNRYIRNHYGIELPLRTIVGRRVLIAHQSGIVISPYAEIGDDCLIRQNVTIGAVGSEDEAPKLGRGVKVGCGAVIVGKIRVGDGVFIGPNAVVMTSIPAGASVFVEAPRMIQLPKTPGNGKEGEGAQ